MLKVLVTTVAMILFLNVAVVYSFELDFIKPVVDKDDHDRDLTLLGKRLFTDPNLSADGTISCSSCHDGEGFGVDSLQTSKGIGGTLGEINAPTTFNARFNFVQFHDGRARSLEEQALGPIENPIEMGNTLKNVLEYLKQDNYYRFQFERFYEDGVTAQNLAHALSEFERGLVNSSRFDEYLLGNDAALGSEAREGYELFKSYGCIACHNGINIGGNSYQKLGIFKDYNGTSLGRYNVTKDDRDKNHFKVPTLRNISWTKPYLHDGSIYSLKKAIEFMGEYQLGITINSDDSEKIEIFLQSLTGETPKVVIDE